MENIEIFTGNRAEFGILSPLIEELSHHFKIDLIISGAHLLDQWGTADEVERTINAYNKTVNLIRLPLIPELYTDEYSGFIPQISHEYIKYKERNKKNIKFCLFLGDRIETAVYALSSFYLKQVLIHLCGGDITNSSLFDSSIRHVITKLSHLHLVTNEQSYNIVKQLGEEEWRICNIGMPSLDSIFKKHILKKEELKEIFQLENNEFVMATYHPDQYMSGEKDVDHFREMIKGLSQIHYPVILTYPNNDPGHEEIITEIDTEVTNIKNIKIYKNIGVENYISLLNNFKVILVGNSSSIITESPFFRIPSLLLGKRQTDRLKGENVLELPEFTHNDIINYVHTTFQNYESLQQTTRATQFIYGDGHTSDKAIKFITTTFAEKTNKQLKTKIFQSLSQKSVSTTNAC